MKYCFPFLLLLCLLQSPAWAITEYYNQDCSVYKQQQSVLDPLTAKYKVKGDTTPYRLSNRAIAQSYRSASQSEICKLAQLLQLQRQTIEKLTTITVRQDKRITQLEQRLLQLSSKLKKTN